MPPDARRALSLRLSTWGPREGLSLAVLAGLALFANLFGRLLAPALFGAASGVWTIVIQAVANVSSQVVAAGGVVFALWTVGVTLARTQLGVAYRMIVIPAAIATSALTMVAAAGRVLEPELGGALAISAITAAAASAPLVLMLPSSRAVGLATTLTAVAGAFDFAGMRLSAEAIERGSVAWYRVASALATCGFLLEVLVVTLAVGWLSARRRGRAILLGTLSAVLALLMIWALRRTSTSSASTFEIVVARSLASVLRAPAPFVPPAARLMLDAASWVVAVAALGATRRAPLAPVLALCLIARGSLDIPIPALLLVVAAVALPAYGAVPLGLLSGERLAPASGQSEQRAGERS